jgi:metal-dependent hydrolase (beta-lactamase superfamily II)
MKVITLFENRTISKEYKNKHGLSLLKWLRMKSI